MKVYKIRDKYTRKFYSRKKPYAQPRQLIFSKSGKTWSRLSDVRTVMGIYEYLWTCCEIVEFNIVEVGVLTSKREAV